MYYIVYQTTNLINGKIYIGQHQTADLNDGYLGSGNLLKRAVKKYGIENFQREILYQFETLNEMASKEAELVTEEFCKREDTYNICPGGRGGFGYINANNLANSKNQRNIAKRNIQFAHNGLKEKRKDIHWKQELDKKTQKAQLFKYKNEQHHWVGRSHSTQTKYKMSLSAKKKTSEQNSQYGSMWITDGTINKKIKKIDTIPEGWYKGRNM